MLTNSLYITFHGIGDPVLSIEEDEARYFVTEKSYRDIIALLPEIEERFGIDIGVTFDDGNTSDVLHGLPALVQAGRRAAFFVVADRVGTPGYLGKPEIRSLTDAGMSIGSHGYSHVDWRGLDDAGAQREFVDARKVLADVVGKPVDEAALPFGRFDRDVLSRLKALGYTRVFTSARGTTSAKSWFCPRTSITRDFVAKRDLPALCTAHARFKGWLLSHARRIRYGH